MLEKNYRRAILILDATQLEVLVRNWVEKQLGVYVDVKRYGSKGDRGRDVVGFYTNKRHEGEWDNYQCKQYGQPLQHGSGIVEVGKVLYFAFEGRFTAPKNYFFVAPKGVNSKLDEMIDNPSKFKSELIGKWGKYCEKKISTTPIPLSPELKNFIEQYDFSNIKVIDIDVIVNDSKFRTALVEEFGGELQPPPKYIVPVDIKESESIYISKILDAYGDYDDEVYASVEDIQSNVDLSEDFTEQRERFYSAEVFKCFYRDSTTDEVLDTFEDEVYKGVSSTHRKRFIDGFERMCSVLEQAASLQPSGKLSIHAKIDVKQGYCHHFANEGKIRSWMKK
ncbi:ABC-three component systems C-terminal domain-containing protein [Vibrio crassostreae]|nr:ABC-three component systems C-terminal domain-containing protein [Vibrio crassostreae]